MFSDFSYYEVKGQIFIVHEYSFKFIVNKVLLKSIVGYYLMLASSAYCVDDLVNYNKLYWQYTFSYLTFCAKNMLIVLKLLLIW